MLKMATAGLTGEDLALMLLMTSKKWYWRCDKMIETTRLKFGSVLHRLESLFQNDATSFVQHANTSRFPTAQATFYSFHVMKQLYHFLKH
jgi:hypothetical protein